MTLNPVPSHPSDRGYVLRLHRDAQATPEGLRGRIEHLASGDSHDFVDAAGLVLWLLQRTDSTPGLKAELPTFERR